MRQKENLLKIWAENIQRAVNAGKFGRQKQRLAIGIVTGPRMGGLDIVAREDPAGLKKAFNEQGGLNLAATVPWVFAEGHVNVFSHGRLIRVEAPWPPQLAETNIPLKAVLQTVQKHIVDGWVAGWDDQGRTIIPNFYLEPHWLFSGATGSGKSVAITTAVAQLALHSQGKTHFILIDGKGGESLSAVGAVPYLIGPPAYDIETAAAALAWAVAEMARRYESLRGLSGAERSRWEDSTPRIVLVIDEIQTIVQRSDLAANISILLQQGRAAKINLIISTQHPTNNVLGGNTMKTNLGGRVVFKMNSSDASRVAIGAPEPDARNLLGRGDSYILASGSFARVQIAYLERDELGQLRGSRPLMEEWPTADEGATLEGAAPTGYSARQLAIAIYCAQRNIGRPTLKKLLDEAGEGRIGMQRLYSLQKFSQEVAGAMSAINVETGQA